MTWIKPWAIEQGVGLPVIPEHCEQPWHMFYMLMPSLTQRQRLIAHLKANGISSVFHYVPLHQSQMGQSFGKVHDCPVTEDVSDRLIRLPFFNALTEDEQLRIVGALHQFQTS